MHGFSSAAAFSNSLLDATSKFYGVAAYAFLQQLTSPQNQNNILSISKTIQYQFMKENLPKEAGGQVHRVGERFALIAAAGELASHYKITSWPEREAYQVITKCFKDWLAERGNIDNQECTMILSQIKSFFEVSGESRFSDWNIVNSRTLNRAGFKKVLHDSTYFYVLPEVFRREICLGLDIRTVINLLINKQWLMPGNNNAPYQREYLPGLGRSRCYVFNNKMWEDEEIV